MPDALIVIDDRKRSCLKLVEEMVKIGLIKRVSVKGTLVYGRPYLNNRSIREAYYKKVGKDERERDNTSRSGPVKEE
jgi:hypothetical protein